MYRARVLTALLGIPALLFFVFLGGYFYGALVAVIALVGLREYYSLLEKAGRAPLKLPGYLVLPLLFLVVFQLHLQQVLLLWVCIFLFFSMLPVFAPGRVSYWEAALNFWGIAYLGGLLSFLITVRSLPAGFSLTVLLFIMVWMTDISAFFVGSKLGRRPLSKTISPKKTVEGTVGGIAGSCLAGLLLAGLLLPAGYLNPGSGALLGISVGVAGTLGDLSQSALKRSVDVKDSGSFLPGHGGMLDRFDSLLFAAPVFYYFITLI